MTSRTKTVIIADDHETSVMYLSILMRRLGFTTIPARNGGKVLQLLETVSPDLIVTDIKMPTVDGLTLLKKMKKDRRFSDIPVIMMTAFQEQELLDECMQLGSVGVLTKPIKVNELHHYLQECVIYPDNTRRRYLRFSYGQKVVVEHDGLLQEYYAVTLSEQGIYLRSQNPLPVGTSVKVRLDIQTGQPLTAQGKVIYQRSVFEGSEKTDPGMAIKFDGLSDQHAQHLNSFITAMLTGDLLEEQPETVIADSESRNGQLQERLSEIKQEWQTN